MPSGPPHRAHNNTTTMQYETKTHKIRTDKHKSTHSEMDPVWQNPIQRTVRTAHLSVHVLTYISQSLQQNCHTG